MPLRPQTLDLVCHPACAADGVRGIRVTLTPDGAGGLALAYRLDADLAALRIPAPGEALPRERLWAHTCFELFVAEAGAAAYREFNFSPSGQWMRFDFGAYRSPISSPAGPAPRLSPGRMADGLAMAVELDAALLPPGELVLGLTTVVEHAGGQPSYWALRHPPGPPDFHHREGFALALKAPTP
jgi:hypothetical protein